MRAALIVGIGKKPSIQDIAEPVPANEEVSVELIAATINPADLVIASGGFYAGHPELPYVPGLEAVGVVAGVPRFVLGGGLGVARNGTLSEWFSAPKAALIDLPEGADPTAAVALGTAGLAGWLPIMWRAATQPGEIVLVLGATGTAGMVAVQAARAAGAGKVVVAGRNPARLQRLKAMADEVVDLGVPDYSDQLRSACSPGANVIYDPLWGPYSVAALGAAAIGARVVQVGAAAGPVVEVPSAAIRGRQLSILGYTNFAVPRPVLIEAYQSMVRRSIAGELVVDVAVHPLAEVNEAWSSVGAGAIKQVLVP
jgi:NADPH:quinone reductase-like Zn-dependent oxidoreductase